MIDVSTLAPVIARLFARREVRHARGLPRSPGDPASAPAAGGPWREAL